MAETRAKSIEELMAESTAKLDAILSMVTKLTQSQLITAVEIAPTLQQSTESGQEKYVGTYFWRQQQAWEKNMVAKGDPSLLSSSAPVAATESGLRAAVFGEQGLKQPVHSAPLLPFYTTSGFNSSRTYPDSLILPNQSDTFADIFPVPLGAQIVHLTASGNVEEALASCKLLPPEDASLQAAKEDDMDQSPPSHIVDSEEHTSLECRKMNHNTLMAPVKFLQKKRPSIIERATAEGTEEVVLDAVGDRFRKSNKGRGNISIGSAAREMAAILDTALLQALLLTGQFSASLKLLKVLNYCDVRICEEILRGEQIEERIMDPGSPAVLIVSPFDVLIFKILNYKSTRKKLYYKLPQLCIFLDGSELIKTSQRGISNASRKEEGKGEECSSSPVGKNSDLPHIRSAGLSEDKATLRGEHITSGVVIKNLNAEVVKAVMLADSAQVCEDTIHHGKDNVCGLDVSAGVKENVPRSEDGNHILLSVKISVIVARHEALESLQLGPDFCERITSDAIKMIALCCHRLRKLRLSGIRDVNAEAINSLAKHCPNLTDIGFIDCLNVDGMALGNVISVRFLSVAGTSNMKWGAVSNLWYKLPNLIGLDVSRTDIGPIAVSRLLSSSQSLKVLCALNCLVLEEDSNFDVKKYKGKLVLALFTDIFKGISSLFVDTTKSGNNVFFEWRSSKYKCKNLDEIMTWLEWILSHSLLRIAETNQHGLDAFWLNQGAPLLLSLIQSLQEDVQERATTGLATFVVTDDENANIDWGRAEAVMHGGGIRLLLYLAKSWREGLQSEAAKAIANLSVNPHVAKAVAEEGGIDILASLARSMNRLVAEEAAGGLWNLSVGEEYKGAIAEAGGVKALVDLIFKWSSNGDGVLERAAGALANLAADDKCSTEVAVAGGVHALVMLARICKFDGVQEQAARALANLAAHGDSNSNNAAVGKEAGALDALVQLTHSPHDGVRQEAAGALWNLSFDDRNREAIAAAGGVEALVALAQSSSNASPGLQERAAGALWGLSVSEANSIAIGREGGVPPLIALARSEAEDVHETAAGALWNLAFNPSNAVRIVEDGGVPALVHLCSSSGSKMTRFMAALALAYMFDGRMDEYAMTGTSSEGISKSVSLDGARRMALKHIEAFILTFSDPQAFSSASASSAPAALGQVTDGARIQEAGHLRCSGAEIGRFVTMLRNPSSTLKACAAFALLQFTIPSGRHAFHHASLMQNAGAARVIRAAAAAATAPLEAKVFARIVLRNLEHHQIESSL